MPNNQSTVDPTLRAQIESLQEEMPPKVGDLPYIQKYLELDPEDDLTITDRPDGPLPPGVHHLGFAKPPEDVRRSRRHMARILEEQMVEGWNGISAKTFRTAAWVEHLRQWDGHPLIVLAPQEADAP